MNKPNQYSLEEVSKKKWPENANDPRDDEYELPIFKYDTNQDTLVEHKEGTPQQEEEEPKTPSQSIPKEGEDS